MNSLHAADVPQRMRMAEQIALRKIRHRDVDLAMFSKQTVLGMLDAFQYLTRIDYFEQISTACPDDHGTLNLLASHLDLGWRLGSTFDVVGIDADLDDSDLDNRGNNVALGELA